jgi:hypothetical protein
MPSSFFLKCSLTSEIIVTSELEFQTTCFKCSRPTSLTSFFIVRRYIAPGLKRPTAVACHSRHALSSTRSGHMRQADAKNAIAARALDHRDDINEAWTVPSPRTCAVHLSSASLRLVHRLFTVYASHAHCNAYPAPYVELPSAGEGCRR